jgi:hypothetical protein
MISQNKNEELQQSWRTIEKVGGAFAALRRKS